MESNVDCLLTGNEDMGSVQDFHLIVFVFGVNQENWKAGEGGGFNILMCNPSGGNLLRQSIRVSHLEFRQTSTMELLCYNSQWAYHFDCFRKKASSQTSDLIPNADPTKRCCKFEGVGVGRVGQQIHGIGGRSRIKL